ncbi:hypothetical protein OEG84_25180 [Hoeflea sp. G2-23]|uniref:Uncharacterized protein n=1 Tax=Hoeflea algicola TaxID=2983763 RepID=A0ABT3ZGG9_9HYPH|nr:hypothetical protein [Hoeflea algicola]MCY0150902.1 hypothetical protein [Hoeflea algicola]
MAKRDHWTPEQREAERVKNRERMKRKYAAMTPEERHAEVVRRKERETQKAKNDAHWAMVKARNRAQVIRRYYQSRSDDHEFWSKRKSYLARWRKERLIDEEFEAFMARIGKDQ